MGETRLTSLVIQPTHVCCSLRRRQAVALSVGVWTMLSLACGGRTPLDKLEGVQGAKWAQTDAGPPEGPDARDGAVDLAQASAAIHLTASMDDPLAVNLRWMVVGLVQPTTIIVRRDGVDLAVVDPSVRDYRDPSAGPGSLSAVATLSATQGTRTDAVGLSWSAATTAPGTSHIYQVLAVDGKTQLVQSDEAKGWRAAPPLLGYEFSRDDGANWQSAGTSTSFDDTQAPLGAITAPVEATARYPLGYVRLQVTAEPSIVPPPSSTYRVRAKSSTESCLASPPATGFRGVGTIVSYQWQRSAGNRDADYSDLVDVAGSLWFDDTVPLEETRTFRAALRADGATGFTAGVSALVKRFKSVSVGSSQSCGIVSDGKMICWGPNGYGQAPPGFSTDSYRSVVASWANEVTCAIREDSGAVDCWGQYSSGSPRITPPSGAFQTISIGDASGASFLCGILTDGTVYCPISDIAGPLQSISAGSSFACAVLSDGSRVCTGANNRGQAPPDPSTDKFRSIGTGEFFACGLRTDDTVVCWGQLTSSSGIVPSPTGTFKSLSVGRNLVCAIDPKGKMLCWDASFPSSTWQTPPEAGDSTFASVSAGNASACAVRDDGKVVCWGANLFGSAPSPPSKERFGSITVTDILGVNFGRICGVRTDGAARCWGAWLPVPDAMSSQHFTSLSLGPDAVCGVRDDDKLVCWGSNSGGQAPPGPSSDSFSAVSMGALDTCALRTDGKISCWGEDNLGEAVPPDASFTTVSMGFNFGCGLSKDGQVLCWGDGQYGQATPPDGRFTTVSAGMWQACGLDSEHHAVCWGQTNSVLPPTDTFKSVSAAAGNIPQAGFACGVRSDDRVVCWGNNMSADTPSRPTLDRFLSVQAGTCGIRVDNHVVCWGGLVGF